MTTLAFVDWHMFFFTMFALVACVFALGVLFSSNIVHMAFYLIISLGATSGLFFLAGAEFLGAMQLMIYVGGTLVLLIFGVMLTAQKAFVHMKTREGEVVMASAIGLVLLGTLLWAATRVEDWQTPRPDRDQLTRADIEDTARLGGSLVGPPMDRLEEADPTLRRGKSSYLLAFEIISMHLLVVLIGAAYLARTKRRARAAAGTAAPEAAAEEEFSDKQRPRIATGLLVFILAVNILAIPLCLLLGDWLLGVADGWRQGWLQSSPDLAAMMPDFRAAPGWFMPLMAFSFVASSFCVLALLHWQRWGFFGLIFLLLVQLVFVWAALGGVAVAGGFLAIPVQIGILFLVLRMGRPSTWSQLE